MITAVNILRMGTTWILDAGYISRRLQTAMASLRKAGIGPEFLHGSGSCKRPERCKGFRQDGTPRHCLTVVWPETTTDEMIQAAYEEAKKHFP